MQSQIIKEITVSQQKFADEFLKCGCLEDAAEKTGYSRQYAKLIAAKPSVDLYIRRAREKIEKKGIADVFWKLSMLEDIVKKSLSDDYDSECARTAISAISESNKMCGHYAATKVESINVNVDADFNKIKDIVNKYERDY